MIACAKGVARLDVVVEKSAIIDNAGNEFHGMPLSRRQAGLLNEAVIAQSLPAYPLEQISAPTLVISVADDLYGTYESAAYTASRIPGSRLVGYAQGGHVWVGHQRQILAELSAFLSAPDRRAGDSRGAPESP